jgi:hypothetical protein
MKIGQGKRQTSSKSQSKFFPSKSSFLHHILQAQSKKKKRVKAKHSSQDLYVPPSEVDIAFEQQRAAQLT